MSSNEDLEDPYLAPQDSPPVPPNEDLKAGYYSIPKDQSTAQTAPKSPGEDSIPNFIDLQEQNPPPPVPPKRAAHPSTLGLDKERTMPEQEFKLSPTSKGRPGKPAAVAPHTFVEPV